MPSVFAAMGQDCLRLFSKEERLTDNNKVFCRHCKAHRDSTKKLEIWKVPPIVLVHLKRYVPPLVLLKAADVPAGPDNHKETADCNSRFRGTGRLGAGREGAVLLRSVT